MLKRTFWKCDYISQCVLRQSSVVNQRMIFLDNKAWQNQIAGDSRRHHWKQGNKIGFQYPNKGIVVPWKSPIHSSHLFLTFRLASTGWFRKSIHVWQSIFRKLFVKNLQIKLYVKEKRLTIPKIIPKSKLACFPLYSI